MNKKTFAILCIVFGTAAVIIAIFDIIMVVSYFSWLSKADKAEPADITVTSEIESDIDMEEPEKLQPEQNLPEEPLADEYEEDPESFPESIPSGIRVVCWGDSLTEGTKGGDWSYPKGIKDAASNDGLEIEVLNYGVYAEESSLICARSGGNPMYLDSSVTVPGDSEKEVAVRLKSKMRGDEMLLVFGGAKDLSAREEYFTGDESINPCKFTAADGSVVEGILRCDPDDGTKFFRRCESVPNDVTINAGEKVSFKAMYDSRDSDILVIWSGNNDKLNKSNAYNNTLKYINEIILYTYFGPDSGKTIEDAQDKPYLVLNLSQIDQVTDIDEVNAQIAEAYPGHVLDIRSFLLNDAMNMVGLNELTEADGENLKNGKMPASLYAGDGVHFTPECYKAVGYRIYEELSAKGFLTR